MMNQTRTRHAQPQAPATDEPDGERKVMIFSPRIDRNPLLLEQMLTQMMSERPLNLKPKGYRQRRHAKLFN